MAFTFLLSLPRILILVSMKPLNVKQLYLGSKLPTGDSLSPSVPRTAYPTDELRLFMRKFSPRTCGRCLDRKVAV